MSAQSQPALPSLSSPDWKKNKFETAPQPKLLEPLLDVKKAASVLGISVKTLRDWIQQRKIDYVKAGTRVMIQPETVREFISRNTRHAISR